MQCPRCDFENRDGNTYCDQCGTLLRGSAAYSSEMEYHSPPPSEYSRQSDPFSYQQKLSPRPSVTVLRIVRSILYFIAAPIAAFGFFGTSTTIFGTSNRSEGLAICLLFLQMVCTASTRPRSLAGKCMTKCW